jgi:hypothetical protein
MCMCHRHRLTATVFVASLALAELGWAQRPTLEDLGKANQQFGMDSAGLRRLFEAALRPQVRDSAATSVEGLADQVSEVRVFLTGDANVVVGEIATEGRTPLTEIAIPLEEGRVVFNDRGAAPDKRRGDGVFTGRFRMSTAEAWRMQRQALGRSAEALGGGRDTGFIRRGPRDIVPVKDALEALKRRSPALLSAVTDSAPRGARIAGAKTAAEAAKLAGVDPAVTPFVTFPARPFVPREAFDFRRVFGIPIIDFFPLPFPVSIDKDRSLMVVEPAVVDDHSRTVDVCRGGAQPTNAVWSFGHLMRELSHGTGMTPEDFTMHWLSTWAIPQEANGFIVNDAGRATAIQSIIIASWQLASGGALSVDRFPARLLAIVNRPDLADKIGYGVAGSAGEGRLVFGLLQKTAGGCSELPFTVIFEYGIKGGSCSAVKAWHQRWKDLEANPVGSTAYNAALEMITKDFTEHGTNPGQVPNGSSINQLRTNEIALDGPWQLREFRLQSSGSVPPGLLDLVTVKQTPDDGFRNGTTGTATVAAYIMGREADILADRHVVPERFPGIFNPFLGAKSNVESSSMFWDAPGLATPPMTDAQEARRKFSLGTCNGCHAGETDTRFTHIGNSGTRPIGAKAALSGFLTGIDVTVPPGTGATHHYEDLAERASAMSNILTNSCFGLLGLRRLPFVH